MRVCLLNDSFPPVIDGVANTVVNYGRVLTQELGASAIVATPEYPGADYSGYPYPVVAYQSIDTSKIVNGYRAGNPFDAGSIEKLSDFHPDLIHSHCPFVSTVMARIVRRETGAPIIFTYHTKFDYDIARAVKAEFLQKESIRFVVENISSCDEVWTVSHGAGENLKSLGYQGDYIVMNNGVDFAKGRVSDDLVRKATEGFDLPAGIPVYLFVGRLMTYKGLPIIIDAMKKLSEEGKDYRMVFVGGGTDAQKMQDLAVSYGIGTDVKTGEEIVSYTGSGIPGKIIFTGAIHDRTMLRAWNTRADLFLFPSTYDTNGIVVREAAACGLASVLIEGSCAAEGITDGRNGYLIEENADSMAALLDRVSGDLSAVHGIGQNAMDEIYLSWDDAIRVAYERYQAVLDKKRSGELEVRREDAGDRLIDAAARMTEMSETLQKTSEYISSGILGNFYNMAEGAKEHAQLLSEDFRRWQEERKKSLEKAEKSFVKQVMEIHDEMEEGRDDLRK